MRLAAVRSLTVNKYRSVAPGTNLSFSKGTNVILGRNGSGKSTLLHIVAALASGDLERLGKEEFDLEYVLDTPVGALTARVRNSFRSIATAELGERGVGSLPAFEFQATIGIALDDDPRTSIAIETGGNGTHYEISGGSPAKGSLSGITGPSFVIPFQVLSVAASLEGPVADDLRVIGAYALNSELQRMDEGLEQFDRLLESSGIWRQSGFPLGVYSTTGGPWVTPSVHAKLQASAPPPLVEIPLEEVPKIGRALTHLGFSSGQARFELLESTPAHDQNPATFRYGRLAFSFTRSDGSVLHHSHLSYGQRRLLAFFGYLAANNDFAVIDELANGLHHSWIGACTEALGDRQSFLTSQNPLLLDALQFESAEDVQKAFVVCTTVQRNDREQLAWRGLSREETLDFWRAYEAGIQQVGEILQQKELW